MTRTKAVHFTGPGSVEVRDIDLGEPGPGDVLVETLASGISAGTERLVFRGGVPPSQHEAMRAPFQVGRFPAPVKYGYAAVGTVVLLQIVRVVCGGLRAVPDVETQGLDLNEHGEAGYVS